MYTEHIYQLLQSQVEHACDRQRFLLDEEEQSYLVHLMARYSDIQSLPMESCNIPKQLAGMSPTQLREIGDQCLLLCGLLPDESASAVTVDELTCAGQSAFRELAGLTSDYADTLFLKLAEDFPRLSRVLRTLSVEASGVWHASVSFMDGDGNWTETAPREGQSHGRDRSIFPFDRRGLDNIH